MDYIILTRPINVGTRFLQVHPVMRGHVDEQSAIKAYFAHRDTLFFNKSDQLGTPMHPAQSLTSEVYAIPAIHPIRRTQLTRGEVAAIADRHARDRWAKHCQVV